MTKTVIVGIKIAISAVAVYYFETGEKDPYVMANEWNGKRALLVS